MKIQFKLLFSVLLVALIAPAANAANILFTLSSGGVYSQSNDVLTFASSGFTLQLAGYTCGNVTLCNSVDTQNDSRDALDMQSGLGVGMADDNQSGVYEIARNEFIQVDFSSVPAGETITSLVFNVSKIVDGWDIYTSNTAGEFDSTSAGPAAQGNNQTGYTLSQFPNINSTVASGATTGSSTLTTTSAYYSVSALQADCEVLLTSISVNYTTSGAPSTPEPATCVLLGGALIGLSLFRRRKARQA